MEEAAPHRDAYRVSFGILAIVAALAMAVRLAILAETHASSLITLAAVDAAADDALARRIAAGDFGGGTAAFFRAPLYPYHLAALYRFGWGAVGVRVLQLLLGCGTAVLVTLLGARLLGRRAGLCAGMAAALYGPFLSFENRLAPATLILALNAGGLFLLERSRKTPGLRPRVLAGLLFGLATLARSDGFFVALVLGCGLLAAEWGGGRRMALARCAAFLGATLLVSSLAAARNWAVSRDLVWVNTDGGITFYLGNTFYNGSNELGESEPAPIAGGREWERLVEMPHREAGLTRASDRSRYFYREALRQMRAEPGAAARHLLHKTARFFAGVEIGDNEDPYVVRNESRLLGLLFWRAEILGFPFGIVAPLALLGAMLLWRRRRDLALLYLYAAAITVSVVAFTVSSPSRLPALIAVLLFTAGAVEEIRARWRTPGFRLRIAGGFSFLVILLNANPAVPRLDQDPRHLRLMALSDYERGQAASAARTQEQAIAAHPNSAELHYEQGLFRTAAGDTAGAIAAYRRAIDLDPGYGEPRVNLGNLLVARGDFAGAVRLYLEAAVADPDLIPAQVAVGNAFLHSGHADSALARYDRALALDPSNIAASLGRINALERNGRTEEAIAAARQAMARAGERADLLTVLGRGLKNAGRNEEAVAALRAALDLEPRRVEAWMTLGQCYRRLGRLEEAEAAQKEAIAIDPRIPSAHVNLADVYARRGLYDQAIASLERALAIDPFHPTALYNLAVVHLELGEEAQAVLMLEKVLAIDPGHEAARHALAEIRGEPSPHRRPGKP